MKIQLQKLLLKNGFVDLMYSIPAFRRNNLEITFYSYSLGLCKDTIITALIKQYIATHIDYTEIKSLKDACIKIKQYLDIDLEG